MTDFRKLADNGLFGYTVVVDAPRQKKLRNRKYKLCLNDTAISGCAERFVL